MRRPVKNEIASPAMVAATATTSTIHNPAPPLAATSVDSVTTAVSPGTNGKKPSTTRMPAMST